MKIYICKNCGLVYIKEFKRCWGRACYSTQFEERNLKMESHITYDYELDELKKEAKRLNEEAREVITNNKRLMSMGGNRK